MLPISVDSHEDSVALAARKGITVPLLSDPDMTVISAYGVAMEGQDIAVPATFIVGPDGAIVWRYIGESMSDRPNAARILELIGNSD